MAPEPGEAMGGKGSKGKSRLMPILIVILLMGIEGVGIFFLAKAVSPAPVAPVAAAGTGSSTAPDGDDYAEVELAECRPSNKMSGKFITFHIRVSALVSPADLDKAEKMVRAKQARLEDGVNTVIRSAEPKHFAEPGLETIKRRLKHEFDQIFGDDQMIKKVLIPQLLQSGPGV